jgi:molybdate transport system ATP-binding protein
LGDASSFAAVQIRHRIGALDVDVDFRLTQPWTILFGPSGSGKTTMLRAMAGLVRLDAARIVLGFSGGEVVVVDTKAGVFIPAHLRCTRAAAQHTALFPHMTVKENIAFGVGDASGVTAAKLFAEAAIDRLRLSKLSGKMPAELSGGERQRVAIARAAAAAISLEGPAILLLDEPLAGMDSKLRDELIADLQSLLAEKKIPVLSVTHDVAEAFQLDAEVIKLAEGKVMEQGPVATVLAEERKRLLEQLNAAEGSRG